MAKAETIVITGASGQLGRLVLAQLRAAAPAAHIVALARKPEALSGFPGIEVRAADYTSPESLGPALTGADKVLLISSSEVGQRFPQHRNVIDAARAAGVKLLAYTSLLRADVSPMALATEHRQTEDYLTASGLPHVVLRNGWYTENYLASLGAALDHGAVLGAAGQGRIASASRADYAAAAVAVLTSAGDQAGKIYELAGDEAYTLADLAAEIARQSGKPVVYKDLPEADFRAVLVKFGLPSFLADILSESDAKAAQGALFDDSHSLSRLIGRPTTPLATALKAALAA
jgi:NAD(P)H dehydrogenase (quinone)